MPSPWRYADVKAMLERCGYRLHRVNGSHHVFKNAAGGTHSIPVHNKQVKYAYVRNIQKECGEG